MHGLLQQLQVLTSPERKIPYKEIKDKITELSNKIHETNNLIAKTVSTLKSAAQNPIASYYWVLFVLIYIGAYMFQ